MTETDGGVATAVTGGTFTGEVMELLEGGDTSEGIGEDDEDEGVAALGKEAALFLKLLATAGVLVRS